VFEYVNGGAVTVFNVIGTNLISREIGSDKVYYFYNGHGDVTALLDATTKNIRSQYQYDSFGNITLENYYDSSGVLTTDPGEMIKSQIRYAGYQYDEESDYYNLHARYYDPKIARFLQQDTYTGTIDDPLSLNLYTYCANNPLIYWDPFGHVPANVQFGDIIFETGDVTDGVTTITEEEYLKYGLYILNMGLGIPEYITKDGNDGKKRIAIREFCKELDIEDTISWWHDSSGKMNILVRPEMKYAPVKVIREEKNVYISAYINFTENITGYTGDFEIIPDWIGSNKNGANEIYPNSTNNLTYAEVIADGITRNWAGNFSVYGKDVSVYTSIYSKNPNPNKKFYKGYFSPKQRFLNVRVVKGTSFNIKIPGGPTITLPNERKLGMADHENLNFGPNMLLNKEKDIFDWSIENASSFTVYDTYKDGRTVSEYNFAQISAHEFGHVLGIGDAYNAGYRGGSSVIAEGTGFYAPQNYTVEDRYGNKYRVKVPDDDMMICNKKVSSTDIMMVLDAWTQGRIQYFPWGTKNKKERENAGIVRWNK
ncbi:MAG: hypothetical protein GX383_07120, partial [Clostridium sp.]|nr:hypothetical protein [Clostridium sp.]